MEVISEGPEKRKGRNVEGEGLVILLMLSFWSCTVTMVAQSWGLTPPLLLISG
jgi:hypothetical protein